VLPIPAGFLSSIEAARRPISGGGSDWPSRMAPLVTASVREPEPPEQARAYLRHAPGLARELSEADPRACASACSPAPGARRTARGECRRVRLPPEFNLHGMSTLTHFSAPLILVNGLIRDHIGLNRGFGVFGPGYRANATIGRALRLLMIKVGGARPGETSRSTFSHPGRYTYCIGENEEASPWPPFHAGTESTSRSTPTRCWSWAWNTPGCSPTEPLPHALARHGPR